MSNISKSNSRDASPSYKTNIKSGYEIKKLGASQTITTKIPNKLGNSINSKSGISSLSNNYLYSKKITSTSKSSLSKSKEKEKEKSRPTSNVSKKSGVGVTDTTKYKSFKSEKSTELSKSKSPSTKYNVKYNYNTTSKHSPGSLNSNSNNNSKNSLSGGGAEKKVNNVSNTAKTGTGINTNNSLLKKYEQLRNGTRNSTSKSNSKINSSSNNNSTSFKNTRNQSKETFKETPKSGESTTLSNHSNPIKNKSPAKISPTSVSSSGNNKSKSPVTRINNFKKDNTVKSKIDFREMNTSPLLISKKFKVNTRAPFGSSSAGSASIKPNTSKPKMKSDVSPSRISSTTIKSQPMSLAAKFNNMQNNKKFNNNITKVNSNNDNLEKQNSNISSKSKKNNSSISPKPTNNSKA